jgi:hypothetical protein
VKRLQIQSSGGQSEKLSQAESAIRRAATLWQTMPGNDRLPIAGESNKLLINQALRGMRYEEMLRVDPKRLPD